MNTPAPKNRSRLLVLIFVLGSLGLCASIGVIGYRKISCMDKPDSLRNPPIPSGAEQVAAGTPNIIEPQEDWEAKEIHFETTAKPEDVYNFYHDSLSYDGWSNEKASLRYADLPGGAILLPGFASSTFHWKCGIDSAGVYGIHRFQAQTLSSGKTLVTLTFEYMPTAADLPAVLPTATTPGLIETVSRTLEGHSEIVNAIAFSPDGQTLASGSGDTTVKLWNVQDGVLLRTLKGTIPVIALQFLPDGQTLASGTQGSPEMVDFWNVSDGTLSRTIQKADRPAGSTMVFSADGQTLADSTEEPTTNDPRTVDLFKVSDGSHLSTLKVGGAVITLAFSPDGHTIASYDIDHHTIQLWKVSDGALLRTIQMQTKVVISMAFSPDGTTLAAGGSDPPTIELLKVSDGTLINTLKGHTNSINSVVYSPDGQTLASVSDDYKVKLWKVPEGTLLKTLEGHFAPVYSVAFSPDGQTLASGSRDTTVRLWKVK